MKRATPTRTCGKVKQEPTVADASSAGATLAGDSSLAVEEEVEDGEYDTLVKRYLDEYSASDTTLPVRRCKLTLA